MGSGLLRRSARFLGCSLALIHLVEPLERLLDADFVSAVRRAQVRSRGKAEAAERDREHEHEESRGRGGLENEAQEMVFGAVALGMSVRALEGGSTRGRGAREHAAGAGRLDLDLRLARVAGEGAARHARGETLGNRDRELRGEPALLVLLALRSGAARLAVEEVLAQRSGLGLGQLAVEIARDQRLGLLAFHVCAPHSSPNSGCIWSSFSLNLARARKSRDSTVPIEICNRSAISW